MKIVKRAFAGTLESSDVYVEIGPGDAVQVDIDSVVFSQFGDSIMRSVKQVLDGFGINGAHVVLKDRGALDCTIRARVETAVRRASGEA